MPELKIRADQLVEQVPADPVVSPRMDLLVSAARAGTMHRLPSTVNWMGPSGTRQSPAMSTRPHR
jgi:hypothetical protein